MKAPELLQIEVSTTPSVGSCDEEPEPKAYKKLITV
jgi:hypothetical protein